MRRIGPNEIAGLVILYSIALSVFLLAVNL